MMSRTFSRVSGIVDGGGLAEQAVGCWERRLVAGLAPEALQRVEQRGLLAADVGTGAPPDGQVEVAAGAGRVLAEQPRGPGRVDGPLQAGGGQRVLAPDVDPTVLCAGGQPRDGHGLDHRERIVLHDDAVLERAGLGLVAVGHHVLGPPGLSGHRPPFHPGGEGRSAPSRQPRGGHRLQDGLRAHLARPAQRHIAAVGEVGLQRLGVGHPDAAQQAQRLLAGLGQLERIVVGGHMIGPAPGPLHEQGGSPLALTQAGPQVHMSARRAHRSGQVVVSRDLAGRVDAHVEGVAVVVGRLGAEQVVEGGHPERLRRGHVQHRGHVVDAARADPADSVLEGMQRRQQEVTALPAPSPPGRVQPLGLGTHHRVDAPGAQRAVDRGGTSGSEARSAPR